MNIKEHKLYYFLGASFSLIAFLLLTLVVKWRRIVYLDSHFTFQLQKYVPLFLDPFFSLFSLLGSFEVLTLILIIVLLLMKKAKNLVILLFFVVGHTIEVAGKTLLFHPGPPYQFFRYNLDFLFPTAYFQARSSYPSGHSFRTVFLAVILTALIWQTRQLSLKKKKILIFFILSFSLIMLISRVSLGEHWFSDVLGGVLLGLSYGLFSLVMI